MTSPIVARDDRPAPASRCGRRAGPPGPRPDPADQLQHRRHHDRGADGDAGEGDEATEAAGSTAIGDAELPTSPDDHEQGAARHEQDRPDLPGGAGTDVLVTGLDARRQRLQGCHGQHAPRPHGEGTPGGEHHGRHGEHELPRQERVGGVRQEAVATEHDHEQGAEPGARDRPDQPAEHADQQPGPGDPAAQRGAGRPDEPLERDDPGLPGDERRAGVGGHDRPRRRARCRGRASRRRTGSP